MSEEFTRWERRHLDILERRLRHLETVIAKWDERGPIKEPHWEKAEVAALKWVLNELVDE